ncbi:MAG TPA: fumarylacetoacetate hydrolase family protein [Bdellovibrionales bacterium]|nr:fumarylacetoacetate hydrolase family protein [Bdellovibrionales bacterium]
MIRNIWAIGRNYGAHAKELGNAVPEKDSDPMVFLKAGSSIVENGGAIRLPSFTDDIHHECEVALVFGADLQFSHITVALDLTARDTQHKLKSAGHPWTLAKSFKDSTALGPLVPLDKKVDLQGLKFGLTVNGETRQTGTTSDMIHSAEKLRRYVIDRFPVVEGDLLLTGTPTGVARIQSGDQMAAQIEGIVQANWSVR